MVPGTPVIVLQRDKEKGDISDFFLFQCDNKSRTHGKSFIKPNELIKVVSYDELEKLRAGTGIAGISKEDLQKLYELFEKSFGDGGEIEVMGDNLISLNGRMDSVQKDIYSIRSFLGLRDSGEKIESSSDWWKWIVGGVAVVVGGVVIYKLLQQKDSTTPTVIINNNPPTGGPANPLGKIGFSFRF